MERAFISVGSNIEPEQNVRKAICLLTHAVTVTKISQFYLTPPIDGSNQAPYYNGVVEVRTNLPPVDLKYAVLRKIERELGRRRGEERYAPRTIDLDLLLYDNLVLDSDVLIIPDPDILHRPFLVIPLLELDPNLILPDTGQPIRDVAPAMNNIMCLLPGYSELLRKECMHE